jgi:hypothetical protein
MGKINKLNSNLRDSDFIVLDKSPDGTLLVSTPLGDLIEIGLLEFKQITTLERFLNKTHRNWKTRSKTSNKFSRK